MAFLRRSVVALAWRLPLTGGKPRCDQFDAPRAVGVASVEHEGNRDRRQVSITPLGRLQSPLPLLADGAQRPAQHVSGGGAQLVAGVRRER